MSNNVRGGFCMGRLIIAIGREFGSGGKEIGEKLADRYRVSRSSLFINGWNNGKESRNDLTLFAFRNARSHTELFKQEVKA